MIDAPNVSTVTETCASLYRESDGFGIALYFSPNLAQARSAEVAIYDLANLIPLTVVCATTDNALDVFRHPAIYSARFADALNERAS